MFTNVLKISFTQNLLKSILVWEFLRSNKMFFKPCLCTSWYEPFSRFFTKEKVRWTCPNWLKPFKFWFLLHLGLYLYLLELKFCGCTSRMSFMFLKLLSYPCQCQDTLGGQDKDKIGIFQFLQSLNLRWALRMEWFTIYPTFIQIPFNSSTIFTKITIW